MAKGCIEEIFISTPLFFPEQIFTGKSNTNLAEPMVLAARGVCADFSMRRNTLRY